MSFLAPKVKQTTVAPPTPPIETETIRNPANKAKGRRSGLGIQSIMSAGLAGRAGGKTAFGA